MAYIIYNIRVCMLKVTPHVNILCIFDISERYNSRSANLINFPIVQNNQYLFSCVCYYRMEEDEVILNVGGTVFITFLETLQKYPKTKLGSLNEDSPHFRKGSCFYFFDRNPELFNTILDFYRNDVLHFPTHICSGLWHQELRYWGLSIGSISDCCHSTYVQYFKNDKIIRNLRRALDKEDNWELRTFGTNQLASSTEVISTEFVPAFRVCVWKFLSEPRSSISAKVTPFTLYL